MAEQPKEQTPANPVETQPPAAVSPQPSTTPASGLPNFQGCVPNITKPLFTV